MEQLRMEPGQVSGEPRPVWDWTNDLKVKTELHLEPSFKEELGSVFLRLRRDGEEMGIWLPSEIVTSLRAGLAQIDAYSTDDTWDNDDSVNR